MHLSLVGKEIYALLIELLILACRRDREAGEHASKLRQDQVGEKVSVSSASACGGARPL